MDCRDRSAAYPKWYKSFDLRKMTVTVELTWEDGDKYYEDEEVIFPVKFEVCPLCNGRGKHINPSIDAHGISPEEFRNDPQFEEDYFGGFYDVTCYECGGRNVVPEIDLGSSQLDKKMLKLFYEWQKDMADFRRECEAERRMGA